MYTDDNCLRQYIIELHEIVAGKPPAQIIIVIFRN
jgi:hypothetical protein